MFLLFSEEKKRQHRKTTVFVQIQAQGQWICNLSVSQYKYTHCKRWAWHWSIRNILTLCLLFQSTWIDCSSEFKQYFLKKNTHTQWWNLFVLSFKNVFNVSLLFGPTFLSFECATWIYNVTEGWAAGHKTHVAVSAADHLLGGWPLKRTKKKINQNTKYHCVFRSSPLYTKAFTLLRTVSFHFRDGVCFIWSKSEDLNLTNHWLRDH